MSIPSPIKALLVCPGHLPFNGYYGARKAYNRGLVIDLTGGRSVVVVVTEAGTLEQRGASQEVYALTQPLVDHYADFLVNGGTCPSAPAGIPTAHQYDAEEGEGLDVVLLPETRETSRVKALRSIVENEQAHVVEGVLVDLFSAGTYLNVQSRINEANQAKFAAMDIAEAIGKCYQVLAKAKANGK